MLPGLESCVLASLIPVWHVEVLAAPRWLRAARRPRMLHFCLGRPPRSPPLCALLAMYDALGIVHRDIGYVRFFLSFYITYGARAEACSYI